MTACGSKEIKWWPRLSYSQSLYLRFGGKGERAHQRNKKMQSLFEITKEYKLTKKLGTERNDLIKEFMDEINKERDGKKYKKLSFVAVMRKLEHIKDIGDLYAFLSMCKDYKNRQGIFSKYFFGALKVK